jgi:hypothetical protein
MSKDTKPRTAAEASVLEKLKIQNDKWEDIHSALKPHFDELFRIADRLQEELEANQILLGRPLHHGLHGLVNACGVWATKVREAYGENLDEYVDGFWGKQREVTESWSKQIEESNALHQKSAKLLRWYRIVVWSLVSLFGFAVVAFLFLLARWGSLWS